MRGAASRLFFGVAATIGFVSPSWSADDNGPSGGALVIVGRATNACFSDLAV